MRLSQSLRRGLSLALCFIILSTQLGCASGKALAKRWLKGGSSPDLGSSFDASVPVPPPPQTAAALNVPVKVLRKPATSGIPLAEGANVRDAAQLTMLDSTGKPVPAQFRVLSRWRGQTTDASRPIKWVLVDTVTPPGDYRLTLGSPGTASAALKVGTGATLTVDGARTKVSFASKGPNLITSLIIDNKERLAAPFNLQVDLPRKSLLAGDANAGTNTLKVMDPGVLRVGSQIKFEHVGQLAFEAPAGADHLIARDRDQMYEPNRTYRLEEGTPRQEDVFIVRRDDRGWIYPRTPLAITHPAKSTIKDLGSETEMPTVKSIQGQIVTLNGSLRLKHNGGEKLIADAEGGPVSAVVDETKIEESGPVRVVIRQDGAFPSSGPGRALRFTARYHVYANEGFVRVQLRLLNTGPFGFGGERTGNEPFGQHVVIRSLTAFLPLSNGSGIRPQKIVASDEDGVRTATVTLADGLELSACEFGENFPKALSADATGARFDILPAGSGDFGREYLFEGARAKTTDFYIGLDTKTTSASIGIPGMTVDPEYAIATRAIRPLMVEKRNWSRSFADDRTLGSAAMRMERWLAGAYAVEANDSAPGRPAQSIFEARRQSREGTPEPGNGHFGWRNFGDLMWADGYTNVHYDIPYILLREFFRTGDRRAFQLGSETARYRSDWGQHHTVDFWDSSKTFNLQGFSFYEKGDHGTYKPPLPSHHWVEGLWLYWAMTGDESVHESAREASDVLLKHPIENYQYGLDYNESRWAGWPLYGLVAAWRYSGNIAYLEQSKRLSYMMMQMEEKAGRKGYYIPAGSGIGNQIQPFMWSGYSQLGVIEYWRETGDQRISEYLVRVAEWLIGAKGEIPVLKGGRLQPGGKYEPLGTAFYWTSGRELADPRQTELSMMSVPILTFAARVTGRQEFKDKARLLFRDVNYYRDSAENAVLDTGELSVLNFRSLLFGGSYVKAYGHFGLFVPEYLADYVSSSGR